MGRRLTVLGLALLATLAWAQEPAAPPPDLGGEWRLSGWNTGVARTAAPSYQGKVTLERRDHDTYLVTWAVDGRVNTGVGLYDPRTGAFAAGYAIAARRAGDPPSPGVAIYSLTADRKVMDCVGTFQATLGRVAFEEWRRD